jgi:hypothetical protein
MVSDLQTFLDRCLKVSRTFPTSLEYHDHISIMSGYFDSLRPIYKGRKCGVRGRHFTLIESSHLPHAGA